MTAGEMLKAVKDSVESLVGTDIVSPTMYDPEHLDNKVAVLVFENDEKGRFTSKFKITVEDISKTQNKTIS